MTATAIPEVLHTYQNHHLDSRRWDTFKPRPDDIVVSTAYKSGTTLMQTIVVNLLFPDGNLPAPVSDVSPWLDMRIRPTDDVLSYLEAQPHRRCIKTHLALDGVPYFKDTKYIMVGRDPRDVFMSLVNHYANHTPGFFDLLNNTPGRVGEPLQPFDGDVHALWRNWVTRGWFDWEADGYPYWSSLHHARTWWDYRHLPNIELYHYNDLRADLEGQMRKIADYLEIDVPASAWPDVVRACRFETVKAHPEKVVSPQADTIWKNGAQTFINKGTNGRWKDVLSAGELALYEDAKRKTLPEACARWLETGGPYD